MTDRMKNMKRLIILAIFCFLLVGCAYANESVELNGVEFKIPPKYQNGELTDSKYKLDDTFSIRCIDGKIPKAIGLWASESEYEKDLTISGHPVRHYCQHNEYVGGDHSHAYFVSENSTYEISWIGKNITKDIRQIIKSTPKSKMEKDEFYSVLDESVEIYKQDKIERLNDDAKFNYIDAKYKSQNSYPDRDDTRLKEIILTKYYQ